MRPNQVTDMNLKIKPKDEVYFLQQMKKSQSKFSHRTEKKDKKEPLKNQQIKIYNEQSLPDIKEGITLDKYFGCTFTVVNQDGFKFNDEFGTDHYIVSQDESIQKYLEGLNKILDEFEINEIDEDMYTESNFEDLSHKNSKNQKRSKNIKKRRSPSQNQIEQQELINQQNHEIQQKIINKYQKKKNKSIHKHQDDKIRISIKIDYPQQNFQSQLQKNTKNIQISENDKISRNKDEYSNTLTSFTQSINRNRSNSKEKSIKNNDSFDVDYESHIVLRNTSSNIFRYSNYNKNFDDNNIQGLQNQKISNQNFLRKIDDPLINMPKIYYDNNLVKNKFIQQKQKIDKKVQNQDQIILDKYAQRFNLNQDECKNLILGNSISDSKSYRFKSIEMYKRQIEEQ